LLLTLALLATGCGETTPPPPATPSVPVLSSPADGTTGVSILPRLEWQESVEATAYGLQLSLNPDFTPLVINKVTITSLYYDANPALSYDTTYYWRVNASNAEGTSEWSSPRSFTTEAETSPSGEVIRLYYYGFSGGAGTDPATLSGPHNIYSAISTEGIYFTEEPGVRFSYDTEGEFGPYGITDADVVELNDGSWLMFLSLGTNLLKATSPAADGAFTLDESFGWNQGGVPGSYNFDGTVRTFVCYEGGIKVATYDQTTGTLQNSGVALNAPPEGLVADPSVIKVDDQYLMFYKYCPPNGTFREHEIYLATSEDGISWTQHSQNRFIGMGSVPGAVYYDGVIYVYFCGLPPGSTQGDLGMAISRDKGESFSFSTITIEGKAGDSVVDPAAIVTDL